MSKNAVKLTNTLKRYEITDVLQLLDNLSVIYVLNPDLIEIPPSTREIDMKILNCLRNDLFHQKMKT